MDSQPFNNDVQMGPITRESPLENLGLHERSREPPTGVRSSGEGRHFNANTANVPDNARKGRETPALGRFIPRRGTRQGEEQLPSIRKRTNIQHLRCQGEWGSSAQFFLRTQLASLLDLLLDKK
jgi:hypothetical protein